jgi:hypothetical protein
MTEREQSIRLVRVLPAPPEEVFDAWTDPESIGSGCVPAPSRKAWPRWTCG